MYVRGISKQISRGDPATEYSRNLQAFLPAEVVLIPIPGLSMSPTQGRVREQQHRRGGEDGRKVPRTFRRRRAGVGRHRPVLHGWDTIGSIRRETRGPGVSLIPVPFGPLLYRGKDEFQRHGITFVSIEREAERSAPKRLRGD